MSAPFLSSFSPSAALVGDDVVLHGSGFTGLTLVTVCGGPTHSFTVNSDTQVTVRVPSTASGFGVITVVNPDGTSSRNGFTPLHPGPWIQPPDQPVDVSGWDYDTQIATTRPADPPTTHYAGSVPAPDGSHPAPGPAEWAQEHVVHSSGWVQQFWDAADTSGWQIVMAAAIFDVNDASMRNEEFLPQVPSILPAGAYGWQVEGLGVDDPGGFTSGTAGRGSYAGGGVDITFEENLAGVLREDTELTGTVDHEPWQTRLLLLRLPDSWIPNTSSGLQSPLALAGDWPAADFDGLPVLDSLRIADVFTDADMTVAGTSPYAESPRSDYARDVPMTFTDADLPNGKLCVAMLLDQVLPSSTPWPVLVYTGGETGEQNEFIVTRLLSFDLGFSSISLVYRPPRYRWVYPVRQPREVDLALSAITRPRTALQPLLHTPFIEMVFEHIVAADNYADAVLLSGATGGVVFDITGLTTELGEVDVAGHSCWFRWVAPVSGTAVFTTRDTPAPRWDSMLSAYTDIGALPTTPQLLDNEDDNDLQPGIVTADGFGTSSVTFACVAGQTYAIQVSSYDYPASFPDPSAGYPRTDARLAWSVT